MQHRTESNTDTRISGPAPSQHLHLFLGLRVNIEANYVWTRMAEAGRVEHLAFTVLIGRSHVCLRCRD